LRTDCFAPPSSSDADYSVRSPCRRPRRRRASSRDYDERGGDGGAALKRKPRLEQNEQPGRKPRQWLSLVGPRRTADEARHETRLVAFAQQEIRQALGVEGHEQALVDVVAQPHEKAS
jgi:hypothetical protein